MNESLLRLLVTTTAVPLTGVAVDASELAPRPGSGVVAGQDVNRLALISGQEGSPRDPMDQFAQVAAFLRAERSDILTKLAAVEEEIRTGAGNDAGLREAAVVRRANLIDREIRTGRTLRVVEANLAHYGVSAAPASDSTPAAADSSATVKPRLQEREAQTIAERTLAESGRKLVDFWSLTPAVAAQEGRILWQFRFHMKETNQPRDLSVGVTVDDASGVGAIERKDTSSR